MATATKTPAGLSDEQLGEVLALVKGADSVELKLTVPDSGQRSTAAALEMDPLDAQIRQVFFFDTPDLALNTAGVVVRARRIQGKGDDSVVKLRPVVPDALPEELRKSPNLVVEVDAMPGGFVCSASLKGKLDADGRSRHDPRRQAHSEAVLEGAAGVLHRQRPRGRRARRPLGPRPDLRPQAEMEPTGLRAAARRRALALPRRFADPRALDEVRHDRADAGRGRGARVPGEEGRRSRGRAADEDEDGARVLRERAL